MTWFDLYLLLDSQTGDLSRVAGDVLELATRGSPSVDDDMTRARRVWAGRNDCGHDHRREDLGSYDDGPYPPELVVAMEILDVRCAHPLPEPLDQPATGRSCARNWGHPCDCGVDDSIERHWRRLGACGPALVAEAERLRDWQLRQGGDPGEWED